MRADALARSFTIAQASLPCRAKCNELLDKARCYGTVNIIVGLNIDVPPEQTRRDAAEQAEERLLKALANHKVIIHSKLSVTLAVAMTVDEGALRVLIAHPEVRSIGEDVLMCPASSPSVC